MSPIRILQAYAVIVAWWIRKLGGKRFWALFAGATALAVFLELKGVPWF